MLTEIERCVNWVRRRNPYAHTWRDYRADLKQFLAVVGSRPPRAITFHDVDLCWRWWTPCTPARSTTLLGRDCRPTPRIVQALRAGILAVAANGNRLRGQAA
jgi:hypothetical protein